ncbi:MAG: hypothetical protein FWF44_00015 [Defluviitaleaceae bacterium]|nr:hypothetical protein [Defluviitaleaceae bacterium]
MRQYSKKSQNPFDGHFLPKNLLYAIIAILCLSFAVSATAIARSALGLSGSDSSDRADVLYSPDLSFYQDPEATSGSAIGTSGPGIDVTDPPVATPPAPASEPTALPVETSPIGDSPDDNGPVVGIDPASIVIPTTPYSYILNGFTTDVAITDSSGNPVSNGVYTAGATYNFKITFTESSSGQNQFWATYDDDVVPTVYYMQYQLPAQITVPASSTNNVMYATNPDGSRQQYADGTTNQDGSTDVILGWYDIDATTNIVTFHFNNVENTADDGDTPVWVSTEPDIDPVTGEMAPVYFFTNNYFSTMYLNLSAQFNQSGDNVYIDFGDSYNNKWWEIEPAASVSITAAKAFNSYDPDTKKVTFTVSMTANGGDVADPVFDDNMTLDGSAFTMTKDMVTVNSVSLPDAGTPGITGDGNGHVFFSFPGYTLKMGQTLSVNYSVDISSYINNQNPYSYSVHNYVSETADDLTASADAGGTVSSAPFFDKIPGVYKENLGMIKWNGWTVGDGSTPLNNATVTDKMPDGLQLCDANGDAPVPFETNFQLFYYSFYYTNSDGYTGRLIHAQSGYYPGYGFGGITVAPDYTSFSFKVPAADALDPNNGNAPYGTIVKVTCGDPSDSASAEAFPGAQYYTKIIDPLSWNGGGYTNHIGVDFNSDGTEDAGKDFRVSPPRPSAGTPDLSKDGKFVTVGGETYIDYTIKYTIPGGLHNEPVWITDFMNVGWNSDSGTLFPNVDFSPSASNTTVSYSQDGGATNVPMTWGTDFVILHARPNDGYNGPGFWCFTFNTTWHTINIDGVDQYVQDILSPNFNTLWIQSDKNNPDWVSLSPFDKDTVVTIHYQVPLSATLVGYPGTTLLEMLNEPQGQYPYPNQVGNHVSGWWNWNGVTYSLARDNVLQNPIKKTASVNGEYVQYKIAIQPGSIAEGFVLNDTWDNSEMEYVPGSFGFMPDTYTANHGFGPYTQSGGIAADNLESGGYLSGNKLTLSYDDIMRFNGMVFQPAFQDSPGDFSVSGVDASAHPPWADCYFDTTTYCIYYTLKYTGAGRADVTNTANMGDFNSSTTDNAGKQVVSKTMTADSGDVAKAVINVNPGGDKLVGDLGYLTVTDVMNDPAHGNNNLFLFPDTIQVYLLGADGNPTGNPLPLTQVSDATAEPAVMWSYSIDSDTRFTIIIPDETPVQITYKALVLGSVGDNVNIINTANVVGVDSSEYNDSFTVMDTSAGGLAASGKVTVLKRDADTGEPLGGAIFALYVWLPNDAVPFDYDPAKVPAGIPATYTVGTMKLYYAGSGMTATEDTAAATAGSALIKSGWLNMAANAVYALVEVQQPGGYQKPSDADALTLFSYGTQPSAAQGMTGGVTITPKPTGLITVINTAAPESAVINVKKSIEGTDATDAVFTFDLERVVKDGGGNWITATGADAYSDTGFTVGAGMCSFTIPNLTQGTYYYKVEEAQGNDVGWTYDPAKYLFKVVVDDGGTTITYAANTGPDTWPPESAWQNPAGGSGAEGVSGVGSVVTSTLPFTFDPSVTYYLNNNALTSGQGYYNDAVWAGKTKTSNELVAFCSQEDVGVFSKGVPYNFFSDRNGTASALALALASQQLSGLSGADFASFLGLGSGYASDASDMPTNNGSHRVYLMQDLVWYYEFGYKYPAIFTTAPANWWQVSSAITMWAVVSDYNKNVFFQAADTLNAIIAQSNQGKTTSLTMDYTSTGANAGTLAVGHDGFVPPYTGAKQYDMHLSWTQAGGGTVTVTVNGTPISSGDPVHDGDTIEVAYTGSAPSFELVDNNHYLVAGSVKGAILSSGVSGQQNVIVGNAQFVTLKCDLTLGVAGAEAEFTNKFQAPPPVAAEINGHKYISGIADTDQVFTFLLTQVADADGTPMADPYTDSATTAGAGDFHFTVPDLEYGMTYYYKITERNGGVANWAYDGSEYIVKVTVGLDGNSVPAATVEMSSSTYVPRPNAPAYGVDPGLTYEYNENNYAKQPSAPFPIFPQNDAGVSYGATCFDFNADGPNATTTFVLYTYNGDPAFDASNPASVITQAALANSLAHEEYGAKLTLDEFNGIFGTSVSAAQRYRLMEGASQYYSFLLSSLAPSTDPNTWPAYARGSVMADLTGAGLTAQDMINALQVLNSMTAAYDRTAQGGVSSLAMQYTQISAAQGRITYSYNGYQPPAHDVTLSWTAVPGLSVTKNGTDVTAAGSVDFNNADTVMVNYGGSDPVNLTLTDPVLCLMNGSIEGYLLNPNKDYQRLITGYSKYATLQSGISLNSGGAEVSFTNNFTPPPPPPGGPRLPEAGGAGVLPYMTAGASIICLAVCVAVLMRRKRKAS